VIAFAAALLTKFLATCLLCALSAGTMRAVAVSLVLLALLAGAQAAGE
jgi:hypothetical protein